MEWRLENKREKQFDDFIHLPYKTGQQCIFPDCWSRKQIFQRRFLFFCNLFQLFLNHGFLVVFCNSLQHLTSLILLPFDQVVTH